MIAIETKNLKKRFNNFWALRGINLKIPRNQFVSLLGPNGAGKTTLLEILEGLSEPTEGEVTILGYSYKEKSKYLSRIGIALQETHFIDKLTVKEILQLFANIYSIKKTRVLEILELLGLSHKQDTYSKNLSGGLKQRLALGIALLHNPEILFLDEPTTGLDPEARSTIWNILKNLKSNQTTILLTTHYMEEAEMLSDYIYLIDQGKIVAEGTLGELFKKFQKNIVLEFTLEKRDIIKLNFLPEQETINIKSPDKIQIFIPTKEKKEVPKIIKKYLNLFYQKNIEIVHLEIHKPNLNEIFLTLTGKSLDSL